EPEKKVDIANAWWDAAQKETGLAHDALRWHAAEIYRVAALDLKPGLTLTGVEKRIAEVAAMPPPIAVPSGVPQPAGSATNAPTQQQLDGSASNPMSQPIVSTLPPQRPPSGALALNQWIDLLKIADMSASELRGNCSRDGSDLTIRSSGRTRLPIPLVV